MASIFGFFKRKPRPDAPAATPDEAAVAPSSPGETSAPVTAEVEAPGAQLRSSNPGLGTTQQRKAPAGDAEPAADAVLAGQPPGASGPNESPALDGTVDRPDPEAPPATEASPAESARGGWFSRLKEMTVGAPSAPAEVTTDSAPAGGPPVAEVPEAPLSPAPTAEPAPSGWFSRLKEGLSKTRDQFGGRLAGVFGAGRKLDEAFYEDLETVLLTSDVGVSATEFLLDNLRARARREGYTEAEQLKEALGDLLLDLLRPLAKPLDVSTHRPFVIMLAGVNGSGKTTSIGKLTRYYQQQGKKVLLAAGDTFRAAAREQLMAWGERNNVTVVTQQSGDAAAVIFDAVNAANARGVDIVLADTAGRLPTQLHLMDEIKKVKRVVAKALPGAPHEVLLVLDANTGQNALAQVKAFDDALGVTGLVMTKLDGTAKGGVIAAIAHTRAKSSAGQPIPLRFIGVGEGIDDLRPFDAEDFVEALLGDEAARQLAN
jgi:fused signal recognition particle receptor